LLKEEEHLYPSAKDLFSAVEADPRVLIYPLDKDVIETTMSLSAINEMHDRQITATAIVLASKGEIVQLLTCDRNITASALVPVIW
jgi:hypothetical protein